MSEIVSSAWYADFFTELPNEFWRRVVPPAVHRGRGRLHRARARPAARCPDPRRALRQWPARAGARRARPPRDRRRHLRRGPRARPAGRGGCRRRRRVRPEPTCATVPRDGAFDAAVCLGNSFGYLDLAGTREFVAALAAAVRPGGGLVIDFSAAAETVLPGYRGGPRTPCTVGDITVAAITSTTWPAAGCSAATGSRAGRRSWRDDARSRSPGLSPSRRRNRDCATATDVDRGRGTARRCRTSTWSAGSSSRTRLCTSVADPHRLLFTATRAVRS